MPTVICPRRRTLLAIFGLWKTLLLCIAVCSPGPGYDSSTSLLWLPGPNGLPSRAGSSTGGLPWMGRLVRWDAIYFIKIAERGYRFEQEWAFGAGFANAVALISRGKTDERGERGGTSWLTRQPLRLFGHHRASPHGEDTSLWPWLLPMLPTCSPSSSFTA